MSPRKTHEKHIACLETLWDRDIEDRLSVLPLLELVSKINDNEFSYLSCNTRAEFEYNLQILPRRGNYRILYLGFHGNPGDIILKDNSRLSLDDISKCMDDRYQDWVIHFGSCGTLDVPEQRVDEFLDITKAALLLGYNKVIDWVDSTALDLIVLSQLQQYVRYKPMLRDLEKNHSQLIERIGFVSFSRE